MTEITPDIISATNKVFSDLRDCKGAIAERLVVSRAIMAERERCIKAVQTSKDNTGVYIDIRTVLEKITNPVSDPPSQ